MVKDDFGTGTLFGEFELHNRVDTGIPIHHAPRLDNSLVRRKFDMTTYDVATEKCECATRLSANFGGFSPRRHAGLHGPAELHDSVKLSSAGECFIDTLAARLKDGLLMDRFRRMGNAILGTGPSSDRACGTASKCNCTSNQLPTAWRIG